MSVPDRLQAALSDRYRLERELGQGGMATVYLAQDLKHDRQVALKVLKPELAAVLGAERFVIEIKTTAVYVQALDGDTVGVYIGGTAGGDNPSQWLSDGTILVYQDPASDIVTLNADRPGAPVPILQADWNETRGRVSPDGKWLAYQSTEAGRIQLLVRAWPGLDRKAVIADSVGPQFHFWSSDNRMLYYVRQGNLMTVALEGTDSLSVLSRRVAFEQLGGPLAAMHPDGRRFLVFRTAASQAADGGTARYSLIVVTGWLTVLRQQLAEGVAQ